MKRGAFATLRSPNQLECSQETHLSRELFPVNAPADWARLLHYKEQVQLANPRLIVGLC